MARPKTDTSNAQRLSMRQLGSAWLREKREKCGLSQREVSNRLGIDSHTFISAIESGGPSLPEDRWEEYAQILGIDWPEFCKNMIMYFKPDIYRSLFGEPSKTETQQGKKA